MAKDKRNVLMNVMKKFMGGKGKEDKKDEEDKEDDENPEDKFKNLSKGMKDEK